MASSPQIHSAASSPCTSALRHVWKKGFRSSPPYQPNAATPPHHLPSNIHTHHPIMLTANIEQPMSTCAIATSPCHSPLSARSTRCTTTPSRAQNKLLNVWSITHCQIGFHLPNTNHHHTFQYFYLWDKISHTHPAFNNPLTCDVLLDLWFHVTRGVQNSTTAQIWCSIWEKPPNLPFPNLLKNFLSIIHCLDLTAMCLLLLFQNCIHASYCFAHHLRCNILHSQSRIYLTQFLLPLCFLDGPGITLGTAHLHSQANIKIPLFHSPQHGPPVYHWSHASNSIWGAHPCPYCQQYANHPHQWHLQAPTMTSLLPLPSLVCGKLRPHQLCRQQMWTTPPDRTSTTWSQTTLITQSTLAASQHALSHPSQIPTYLNKTLTMIIQTELSKPTSTGAT